MFRITRDPSSGSFIQCLSKITVMVLSCPLIWTKEIHAILTETLTFSLPGWAKDLSAPLYYIIHFNNIQTRAVIKFFPCKTRRRRKFTPF